nr:MAG TPA: hypothetical protein [Bacteriophage sp.]
MKLEEGMYVRTREKIVKIEKILDGVMWDTQGHLHYGDFVKASYNIIDILEVGDYVSTITGECAVIIGVYHDINGKKYIRLCNCIGDYYEDDIKSVITHEQMEQMAYKVSEE